MSIWAVTGISGYLGQRLLAALVDDPLVERVVGVDIVPPRLKPEKLSFVSMDIRDPGLGPLFRREGVSALVHLAFVVQATRDAAAMYDVNVGGARQALRAVAESSVSRVLIMSSYAVYGAWPDNPALLYEDSPMRPNPGHFYGEHKVAVELLCQSFAVENPDLALVRLRPAIIVGPHCNNGLGRALRRSPLLPVFAGSGSAVQFVHEDDLAAGCRAALHQSARGVYNIGGKGSLAWKDIVHRAGKPAPVLPGRLLEATVILLWNLHVPGLSSPGELALVRDRLEVSSQKAERELGWQPKHDTQSALDSLLQETYES